VAVAWRKKASKVGGVTVKKGWNEKTEISPSGNINSDD